LIAERNMIRSRAAGSLLAALTFFLALTAQSGCKTVIIDATSDEPTSRAAREPGEIVEVFRDQLPERPYKVIGSVRARVKLSPNRKNTWPDERILKKMKVKALELGADALINLHVVPVRGGGNYYLTLEGPSFGNSQLWIASAAVWIQLE